MFCTDIGNKQPQGEVLHSVEMCFVTSLRNFNCDFAQPPLKSMVKMSRILHFGGLHSLDFSFDDI